MLTCWKSRAPTEDDALVPAEDVEEDPVDRSLIPVDPRLIRALRYKQASEMLREEREVLFAAVIQNGLRLQFASEALRGNRELVLAAVSRTGFALQYASEVLRGDRGVVLAALANNGFALRYASREMRGDLGVIEAAIAKEGVRVLRFATSERRKDRDLLLACSSVRTTERSVGSSACTLFRPSPAPFSFLIFFVFPS